MTEPKHQSHPVARPRSRRRDDARPLNDHPISPIDAADTPALIVPAHWSPEQALAVFECLQALRQALWAAYGPQVQQAWRDQLPPESELPDFDPDAPF
jgi:hypothetical protein